MTPSVLDELNEFENEVADFASFIEWVIPTFKKNFPFSFDNYINLLAKQLDITHWPFQQ